MNTIRNTQTEFSENLTIGPYIRHQGPRVISDDTETVGTGLSLVASSHEPLYVCDSSGHLLGLVSPYQAHYIHRRPYTTKLASIVFQPRHLQASTHVADAVAAMVETRLYSLPVFDSDNQFVGTILLQDILEDLIKRPDVAMSLSSQLTPRQAIVAPYHATVEEVRQLMRDHHISRVVLVDEQNRLMGIVSRQDLLAAYMKPTEKQRFRKNQAPSSNKVFDREKPYRNDTPVRTFANRLVSSKPVDADLTDIVQSLVHSPHGSIVLLEQNVPVALVSMRDLARAIVGLQPAPETKIIMMNPSANVAEPELQQAQELLSRFEEKLGKRMEIAKLEVHFEEPKYQKGTTLVFNVTIIVTPVAGTKLVARSKNEKFLAAIASATAQIEKQHNRRGISKETSAHHVAH